MGRSAKFAKKPSKKEKQVKGMVKAASRPAPRPATPPPQDDEAAAGGSKVKKRKMMRAKVDQVGSWRTGRGDRRSWLTPRNSAERSDQ
jgi:hypothetical protein